MINQEIIERVIKEVLETMTKEKQVSLDEKETVVDDRDLKDITSAEMKNEILIKDPLDLESLKQMKKKTVARIGVGHCGPRLKTQTLLTLRADHAIARDAVLLDVNEELLERLNLFTVQTACEDKDQHLTRPDLGRCFSQESLNIIREKCKANPQVQIIVSDGLSSTAIEKNIENILPVLMAGLEKNNIDVGRPFFVKYGRVPSMDPIADTLNSEVTCILIGERPGLATSESMSAYICYKASVGMTESRRTVVSNIHRGGISGVEAGAYIVDLIKTMLELKVSGVDLKLEGDTSDT